jgi:hypothetical protein
VDFGRNCWFIGVTGKEFKMNKIIEYQVVAGEGDVKELIRNVNQLIKEGFQPFGGISSTSISTAVCFSQAMVKFAKTEQAKPQMGAMVG